MRKADRMVDGVGRAHPPAAKLDHRNADGAGVDGSDRAGFAGSTARMTSRALELRRILHEVGGTAEAGDHLAEDFGGAA